MIHARKDYDRIQDPDNKIPIDEPVFLIRGQDPVGAEAVRAWANLHAESYGGNYPPGDAFQVLMRAVRLHADKMEHWARRVGRQPADVPDGQLRLW